MPHENMLQDQLHALTHRVPGVPAHTDRPAVHGRGHWHGHHGTSLQQRRAAVRREPVREPAVQPRDEAPVGARNPRARSLNHSPARPPRVLAGWQRRIAAFFGREVR
jgi:hypothetical protein